MSASRDALAVLMTGRSYRDEMTMAEKKAASEAHLIVIFGASDDLVELRGWVDDELGAYDGTVFMIHANGVCPPWEDFDEKDDEEMCRQYFIDKAGARKVEALWCAEPGYSWTYRTDVPHATFEIVEDGEPYCRGIVIDVGDLAPAGDLPDTEGGSCD